MLPLARARQSSVPLKEVFHGVHKAGVVQTQSGKLDRSRGLLACCSEMSLLFVAVVDAARGTAELSRQEPYKPRSFLENETVA